MQPKSEMYNVTLRGFTPLHGSINQALSKRTCHGGLLILLVCTTLYSFSFLNFCGADCRQEMLSSYSDVVRRHCQKCNKVFDFAAKFPVVRVRNEKGSSEATNPTEWQALHMSCHYGNGR